jgi:hypothetical protein
MGIRDKEKSRQDIKSNVGAIVGIEKEDNNLHEMANADLTQKAYYITKSQYRKLRMLSASRDVDMSYLIREMLNKYLEG